MRQFLAVAVWLAVSVPLPGQLAMPSWLVTYPGTTPELNLNKGLIEATYTTKASMDAVTAHYQKLFEAQSLRFQPNADGIGVMIRAAAPECDLLIVIHPEEKATSVRVSCAGKAESSTASTSPEPVPTIISSSSGRPTAMAVPRPQQAYQGSPVDPMERHRQLVAEMGIGKVHPDAPAPPLVWPDWLVHVKGGKLATQQAVDQSHNDYLKSKYVTSAPMTEIYAFYRELLPEHGYSISSSEIATGHTISGVQQNALGHVEGFNYPDGHPGPRTDIRISFSRDKLNDPIVVTLKFTPYAYHAPKQQGF